MPMRFLAFALLLGAMLFVHAPAWLVARRLATDTAGLIELRAPTGTVWNGSADAVMPLFGSAANSISLGRLAWRVTGIDWPSGSIVAVVEQQPPAARAARLVSGSDRMSFAGAVRAPAAIAGRIPQLAGWSFGGTLVLDSDALEWSGREVSGNATIRWQNAAFGAADLAESIALGEITAKADASANGIALTLVNSGGSVQLTGSGDTRTGQVELRLLPRADAPPGQSAWLRSHLVAAPGQGDGAFVLRFALPRR
jgi:hypothetical protein